ncbi:hypothetical protein GCM10012279_36230 [Micromonospora yangpuensis]|uniref:Uncharacterized protein n=1 Tax=Micromonospora yangpuensis TaxID=683228 RepID=A0A1C6V3G0_9ACTN|nr:hypothetical protein GCM10012279_36230 [Micromonospora yangpuensis]SCL60768.1 hypothetical protein GA0070617_4468 [Micromonospora yangpuensis]
MVTGIKRAPGVRSRGLERAPATRRFDPRRHRRIAGLLDLWMATGPEGRLMVPTDPGRPLDARAVANLVRRVGDAAHEVRILADDGARHIGLFTEVAGLLGHDVLISPEGADIRHTNIQVTENGTGPAPEDAPLHAVPMDRVTRQPKDWLVLQPPDLATPLPGWFAVEEGLVRPRTGVVGLPLPDGLALATRADFVARRATAHRLGFTAEGVVTVAVSARSGGFLIGNYSGTQEVHNGGQLAALLGDLPLYGADLRLWLTWPSDPEEQHQLAEQTVELAEMTGATVWTPPPGGSAELVDDQRDLRALDPAGGATPWQAHRPRYADGPPVLDSTPDGRLVSRLTRERIVVSSPVPDIGTDTGSDATGASPQAAEPGAAPATTGPADPAPADAAPAELVAPLARPTLVTEGRRDPAYGPPWLRPGQMVNGAEFEAFVRAEQDPATAATDGVASAELFLVAFLDPRSVPAGTDLLRVRIRPGGAITISQLRSHVPARLQYLMGTADTYLLPAARLDRVRVVGGFRSEGFGRLRPVGDVTEGALRIQCAPTPRSIAGLPNDLHRWPGFGTRRAYALLPAKSRRLPRGWLRLYRRQPAVCPGRLLVEVRVPRGRTVDVGHTADSLAGLTLVRTRAQRLRTAGVELILGSRSYDRVRVHRAYRAQAGTWERIPDLPPTPLSAAAARLQSAVPGRPPGRS